jgi:hypothetical protein
MNRDPGQRDNHSQYEHVMIITNMMLSDHDHYKLFSYMLTTIMPTIGHDERTVAYCTQ